MAMAEAQQAICSQPIFLATWPSGKARVCKTLITGSNPVVASLDRRSILGACFIFPLTQIQSICYTNPSSALPDIEINFAYICFLQPKNHLKAGLTADLTSQYDICHLTHAIHYDIFVLTYLLGLQFC